MRNDGARICERLALKAVDPRIQEHLRAAAALIRNHGLEFEAHLTHLAASWADTSTVLTAVADAAKVPMDQMVASGELAPAGKREMDAAGYARWLAVWLLRSYGGLSYPQVARAVGWTDHGSARYAFRRWPEEARKSTSLATWQRRAEEAIRARVEQPDDGLVTTAEAAKRLGIAANDLHAHARRHGLAPVVSAGRGSKARWAVDTIEKLSDTNLGISADQLAEIRRLDLLTTTEAALACGVVATQFREWARRRGVVPVLPSPARSVSGGWAKPDIARLAAKSDMTRRQSHVESLRAVGLLTTTEAAEYLGCDVGLIKDAKKRGALAPVRRSPGRGFSDGWLKADLVAYARRPKVLKVKLQDAA